MKQDVKLADRYGLACAIANLSLGLVLTGTTNLLAWKLIGIAVWWGHVIIGVAGLLVYGYVVDWWLSALVNVAVRRFVFGKQP
jgi:hypothetical protein